MLQDVVPRRDRLFWWREHDRALAAYVFFEANVERAWGFAEDRVNITLRWRWFGQSDLEILVIHYNL